MKWLTDVLAVIEKDAKACDKEAKELERKGDKLNAYLMSTQAMGHRLDIQRIVKAMPAPEILTYSSTQATNCAVCGEHKHTPLRRDDMGGYVCLTCIDKELSKRQTFIAHTP